jgi:hypothetical protein
MSMTPAPLCHIVREFIRVFIYRHYALHIAYECTSSTYIHTTHVLCAEQATVFLCNESEKYTMITDTYIITLLLPLTLTTSYLSILAYFPRNDPVTEWYNLR